MPSAEKIKEIFSHIEEGFGPSFFDHCADNVRWTVTGVDNPLRGTYPSKAELVKPYQRVGALMEPPGIRSEIRHLLIANTGDMAVVEFTAKAKLKSGGNYTLESTWVCRFDGDKIVEARVYMDSAHMKKILEQGEK